MPRFRKPFELLHPQILEAVLVDFREGGQKLQERVEREHNPLLFGCASVSTPKWRPPSAATRRKIAAVQTRRWEAFREAKLMAGKP